MLEQKIEQLTQAVITLTERLASNNQSDAYRQAKAIEAEPPVKPTPAKVEAVPTTAANDATYSLEDIKSLATEVGHKQPQQFMPLLNRFDLKKVSMLDEAKYVEFAKACKDILAEAC